MFNPIVLRSTLEGIRWQDIYFVISPVLFILVLRQNTSKPHLTVFMLPVIPLLTFNILSHVAYCIAVPEYRYFSCIEERLISRHIAEHNALCEPNITTFHRSSLRMLALEIYENMKGNIELTNTQKSIIASIIQESKESMAHLNTDSVKKKNVIFIIVESYMSFTSEMMVDKKEVTPYLNALKRDSTVYFNGHVTPNITIGESSDGQYIYMTGLLPIRSAITISKASGRTLPGLPYVLSHRNMQSRMIIPTHPSVWNQSAMCRQYGFDNLYSCKDYQGKHSSELDDRQLFQLAAEKDSSQLSKPFFSVILTLSMHQPYTNEIDLSFHISDLRMSSQLRNYLNACHYTDKCIGQYLEKLKALGLYENSLIIITADHHVHSTNFGIEKTDEIPLYIINGNIDNSTAWHGSCNQIDIYTTLLNTLGMQPEWCGIGHSLLSKDYQNSLNAKKWDVSEWILQSDFFSKNK